MKKITTLVLSVCLFIFCLVPYSWAINVVPGDRIELKATSSLGVPLHQTSSSSLVGRAADGTVATVLGTDNEQRWLEIELPDGNERWIVEKYVGRVISSSDTPGETTELVSEEDKLTVAAINVENLDPGDRDRLEPLGKMIVKNLGSPDIIVLTEIQDNDGAIDSATTDATQTYNELINSIKIADGANYNAFDIAPQNNTDGGQPGGNIRVGYLYQPARVSLAPGTAGTAIDATTVTDEPSLSLNPGRIEPSNSAFIRSRKPLAAEFLFQNRPLFIIGNHFTSRRGNNDAKRAEQARIVGNFVKQLLTKDTNADVVVAGDLNDLNGSETIQILKQSGLTNLSDLLPQSDRYTYEFRGNLQQLDYILVSKNLSEASNGEFDIVHVNVNQPNPLSDHDPVLSRFTLSQTPTEGGSSEVIFPDLSGEELRSRLASEYQVDNSLGYDKARDYMYSQLDNEDGKVRGIYSNFTVSVNPNSSRPRTEAYQNGNGINAEHSWPQSKGATGVAKSDLHHLFPSRVKVNSLRGNSPFEEIEDSQTQRWIIDQQESSVIPATNIDDYSEFKSGSFEPRESVKGNIARALFYFYTIYRDQADADFFSQQVDNLCTWHDLDAIDQAEVERSHNIALKQGNDNPFVLDPTLVDRLYCRN